LTNDEHHIHQRHTYSNFPSKHADIPLLHSFPTRRSSDLISHVDREKSQPWPAILITIVTTISRPRLLLRILRPTRHLRPIRHRLDRKSTRLNSSHLGSSYAVFCLKKKIGDRTTKLIDHPD